MYDQAGRLIRMVGVEQDITDRKRAESRMELQHSVTRAIAEADAVGPTLLRILAILGRGLEFNFGVFWSVDRGTNTLRCEQIWESATNGWPDLVAVTRDAVLKCGSERPGQVLASRESVFWSEGWEIEKTARSRTAERAGLQGGSAFPVLLRSEVVGVLEFFSVRPRARDDDICALYLAIGTQLGQCIERQRLHEQYRQSQKMEAVGTLAGGIAHDFNNILTAISGYCELARLESSPDAPILSHLEAVQQGATRATKLVRQILAFSRRQEHCRRPLELKAAVVEAISLLRATIPSTIEIKTSFGENVSRILADPTSIHQVLVNLGTNASHAMKGRSGRLDIGVENVTVTAEFAESHPGLKAGKYVRMVVADTGHGMSAVTISRIFEPFFTTKAPGEGTGLGLSVVHGIMQSHEGAIFVHSQTGEGTKFLLYFPAQCETSEPAPECAGVCAPIGERQRVLYVEDEGPLADMGRKILERLNYVVDVHRSPSTALRAFRTNPEAYQVVITDLTMPEMTGLELARELLQLRPGLPVILMTGYAASLDAEQTKAEGLSELLLKPLSVEALGAAVHRALKSTPFVARTE
jgi:signal transduction histidine kinase/CheY-like chemotaxis protein